MNSIYEKFKWLKFVLGGAVLLLGALVIIFAALKTDNVPNIINIVLASGLLVLGLFLLISAFISETHKAFSMSLIMGSIALTGGICMLVARFGLGIKFTNDFIVYILSIFTLVIGVAALFKAIFLIVYHEKGSLIALMFAVAIVGIVGGILGLCFVKNLVTIAYIILGLLLVAIGIVMIVLSALSLKKSEAEKK